MPPGASRGDGREGGTRLHLSKVKTRLSLLPFLETLAWEGAQSKARAEVRETGGARREYQLTADEVAHLIGAEPGSSAVGRLLPAPSGTIYKCTSPSETAGADGPTPRAPGSLRRLPEGPTLVERIWELRVPEKAVVAWSTGKDCAWALHTVRSDRSVEVVGLL